MRCWRIIINLGQGAIAEGFPSVMVELRSADNQTVASLLGQLPAASALVTCYRHWQVLYQALSQRLRQRKLAIEIETQAITHVSEEDFQQLCVQLKWELNQWINSPGVSEISRKLRTQLHPDDEILVALATLDPLAWRLPWHLLDFFEDFPKAEVVLSLPQAQKILAISDTQRTQVQVLGILGDSTGINLSEDQRLLEAIPGLQTHFLEEPDRQQLSDRLWERSWDILFFAGHSTSSLEESEARIYINRHPTQSSLTISQLENALKQAIQGGLKLALFNSCDGVGLAQRLGHLNLPQLIVMREDVPNQVAQEFLKYFLQAFAQNLPLSLALRQSRERLQAIEQDYPCASWLPLLCQTLTAPPLTWDTLLPQPPTVQPQAAMADVAPPQPLWPPATSRLRAVVTTVCCTAIILGVRALGWLQPLELPAYDHMMRLRPDRGPDDRLLVITIDDEDLRYQDEKKMLRTGSIADAALQQLLLQLDALKPAAIGLDLYRDRATSPQYPKLVNFLKTSDRFFGVCAYNFQPKLKSDSRALAPELDSKQGGFADVMTDNDGALRRALFYTGNIPGKRCSAPESLSVRLAQRYLKVVHNQTIKLSAPAPNQEPLRLLWGKTELPDLQRWTGGYQQADDGGYKILLDYRSPQPANTVPLRAFLEGKIQPAWVRDRIILIGNVDPTEKDLYFTPYSENRQMDQAMYGVMVHAQMVSQWIDLGLGARSPLGFWPVGVDMLWISGWSLVGLALGLNCRQPERLLLLLCLGGGGLYGSAIAALLWGSIWIPLVPAALTLGGTAASVWLVLLLNRTT